MSQTYPIGRDNLNQLMQLQLGTESFDIIHKVADNLDLIKKTNEALNNIESSPLVQTINKRLNIIERQSQILNEKSDIVDMQLYDLNEKLNTIEMQLRVIHNSIDELTSRLDAIQPSP